VFPRCRYSTVISQSIGSVIKSTGVWPSLPIYRKGRGRGHFPHWKMYRLDSFCFSQKKTVNTTHVLPAQNARLPKCFYSRGGGALPRTPLAGDIITLPRPIAGFNGPLHGGEGRQDRGRRDGQKKVRRKVNGREENGRSIVGEGRT